MKARIWAVKDQVAGRWIWHYRLPSRYGFGRYEGAAPSWEAAMFRVEIMRGAL